MGAEARTEPPIRPILDNDCSARSPGPRRSSHRNLPAPATEARAAIYSGPVPVDVHFAQFLLPRQEVRRVYNCLLLMVSNSPTCCRRYDIFWWINPKASRYGRSAADDAWYGFILIGVRWRGFCNYPPYQGSKSPAQDSRRLVPRSARYPPFALVQRHRLDGQGRNSLSATHACLSVFSSSSRSASCGSLGKGLGAATAMLLYR